MEEEKKIKVDIGKIAVSGGDETRRVENFNGKENEKYIFLPGKSFKEIIVITSAEKCTHEDLALEYII